MTMNVYICDVIPAFDFAHQQSLCLQIVNIAIDVVKILTLGHCHCCCQH